MAVVLRNCLLLFSLLLVAKAQMFTCSFGRILGLRDSECAPMCMTPDQCPSCSFNCSCPIGLKEFGSVCVEKENIPPDMEFDDIPKASEDKCSVYDDCNECISSDPDCQWCPYSPGNNSVIGNRCRTSENNTLCPVEPEDPQPSYNATKDVEFGDTVQRRPQQIHLQLRRGKPLNFTLKFRAAENFPLDVYFLLDSTGSFSQRFRSTVGPLAETLVSSLSNISQQYAVAFGGFADKRSIPFAFPSQDPRAYHLIDSGGEDTCTSQDLNLTDCNPTISFIHTTDFARLERDQLRDVLDNISIHLNIDGLEGGMDALVQAITCSDVIGWRDPSLRMLLYMSNAGFHLAGDGKVGAVLDPNPGVCLLENVTNEDGTMVKEYNDDTLFDYPSVYQLRDLATITQTNIVFAVTSEGNDPNALKTLYQELAAEMDPFGRVVALEADSSNLVSVIEEAFNAISQEVVLSTQQFYEGLEFTFTPGEGCGNASEGRCTNIGIGTTASITVTVSMTSCDAATRAVLTSPAFGNVELTIEPLCECDCNQDIMNSSELCNGMGDLQCGQCQCEPGRGGEMCECDTAAGEDPTCGRPDGPICSGPIQGRCNCGTCECFLQEELLISENLTVSYFGDQCECDPKTACGGNLTADGELCFGHGTCQCPEDVCQCEVEPTTGIVYGGNICQCDPLDTCYSTEFQAVCVYTDGPEQDSATCSDPCDGCDCSVRQGYDQGPNGTCVLICNKYMECARCAKELQGEGTDCSTYNEGCVLHTDDTIPVGEQCTFLDGENCVHTFYVNPATKEVRVIDERECSNEQSGVGNLVWIIPVAVIAALLLLGGLILLLVLLIVCIKDRLEYSRFKQDLEDANWDQQENPMYVSPSTQYSNVIYRPKKGIKAEDE